MIKHSKQAREFLAKQQQKIRQRFKDAIGWDSIEEVEPDEVDLKMIDEIQDDPDCRTFD